jgi:hypothetical protein
MTENIKLVNLKKKQQAAKAKIAHLQDRKIDLLKEVDDIDEEIQNITYSISQMLDAYT